MHFYKVIHTDSYSFLVFSINPIILKSTEILQIENKIMTKMLFIFSSPFLFTIILLPFFDEKGSYHLKIVRYLNP